MTKEELIKHLNSNVPMSEGLNFLLTNMHEKKVSKGAYLINRLTPPGGMFFVAKGVARAYYQNARHDMVCIFDEWAVIFANQKAGDPTSSFRYVQCIKDSVFYTISGKNMEDIYAFYKDFRELLKVLHVWEDRVVQHRKKILAIRDPDDRYDYVITHQRGLIEDLGMDDLAAYLQVPISRLKRLTWKRMPAA